MGASSDELSFHLFQMLCWCRDGGNREHIHMCRSEHDYTGRRCKQGICVVSKRQAIQVMDMVVDQKLLVPQHHRNKVFDRLKLMEDLPDSPFELRESLALYTFLRQSVPEREMDRFMKKVNPFDYRPKRPRKRQEDGQRKAA